MTLMWSSGEVERKNFFFLMTFVDVSRLNSFVERSSGLSHDDVVKSRRDDFEKLFLNIFNKCLH